MITTFLRPGMDEISYMRSSMAPSTMARRPRAPVLRTMAWSAMASMALALELQVGLVQSQRRLVLADDGVLGFGGDAQQVFARQFLEADHDGQASDELGDEPEADQVLGVELAGTARGGCPASCVCTDEPKPRADLAVRRSMILSRPTKAPPQMKRILVVSILR